MPGLSAADKQKVLNSVPKVCDAVGLLLPTINPLLEEKIKIAEYHQWVGAFILLVVTDPLDKVRAIKLGQQLELLDSFQPADLLCIQDTLQYSLVCDLSEEIQFALYPTLMTALCAVISGFYIGKARRAAAIDMSVASRMGHDLKTPINAITGFSHVILKEIDGPITPFQKEDLTSIHEAGRKLLTMINDLSVVMKQDANRTGIYSEKFKVADLISELVSNMHPLCASAGHTLTFKLEPDLGTMDGNPSTVRWILLSLLLYLSRQGVEWQISLSASRQVVSEQAMLVFYIEGYGSEVTLTQIEEKNQVTSIEMINRDIGLATCWRFCTSMGASLTMFTGQSIAFDLHIPSQTISNEPV
jgi:signal transduction histidine kinase